MAHFSLLSECPFRPEEIKPGDFDFEAHLPGNKKQKREEKSEKKRKTKDHSPSCDAGKQPHNPSCDAGKPHLPKRLLLSAFSTVVGHRAMGLQVSQAKLFVQRFPSEFRIMSLGKAVLPMKNGKP